MKLRDKRKWGKWITISIAGALLITACVVLAILLTGHRAAAPTTKDLDVVKPPAPTSLRSNSLFFGNAFWGRNINAWSQANELGYGYPFSRLNEFNRGDYDAWIAGLECPTVKGLDLTVAEQEATLSFNCPPEYVPEAAKWFTAFTLANNHTDNQGAKGFEETKQHLDENGIQYFGHYDPTLTNEACEVIALPVTVSYDDNSTRHASLPVAMCGFHGVFQIPPEETIAQIEKYSPYMPVIVMPHMGVEYQPAPDQLKTSVYRSMIDYGADMVLGDHPHWVQTTESYKGHLIVYSMGNFMFDQQDTLEVTRSAAINVVIGVEGADEALLGRWLAISELCKQFHDNCLEKITTEKLAKLPFTYKFGVIATDDSNKITKPASSVVQQGVLQRLNWQTTMNQLQTPYQAL